jgi:hypothetical protein
MLNGLKLLMNLKATSGETSDYFTYHSVKIKNASLDKGIEFYQIGIDKFLGNCLIKRLEGKIFENVKQLRDALKPRTETGSGKWVDLAGLFTPEECIGRLMDDIENDRIKNLEQLDDVFKSIHENYPAYEWAWAASVLEQQTGKELQAFTPGDVIEMVNRWKQAVVNLDHKLYADAKKEFSATAQTGFGLDGDERTKKLDFATVRGVFEENSFVAEIQQHIKNKTELGEELITRMEKIK